MNARAVLLLAALAACAGKSGPRDLGNRNRRSEFASGGGGSPTVDAGADAARIIAKPETAGKRARVLAHASARAIATNATHVFYGDAEDNWLYTLPKNGDGTAERLAQGAPMPGSLSLDGSMLAWIKTPGDAILRSSTARGPATTMRDRGIFTDVIVGDGDIFFTEAAGRGGTLSRITGATAARLASFEGSPRGLALDKTHVYVATTTKLVAVTRLRNEARELAASPGFANPQVDDAYVYATTTFEGAYSIVRVAKKGGSLEAVVRDVRHAPIALHEGVLAWFDPNKPALMAKTLATGATRVLTEAASLTEATALTLDDDGAFIAAGDGADAIILSVPY